MCLCDVYCCHQAMLQRVQDGSVMLCLCVLLSSGNVSERSRGFSDDVFI